MASSQPPHPTPASNHSNYSDYMVFPPPPEVWPVVFAPSRRVIVRQGQKYFARAVVGGPVGAPTDGGAGDSIGVDVGEEEGVGAGDSNVQDSAVDRTSPGPGAGAGTSVGASAGAAVTGAGSRTDADADGRPGTDAGADASADADRDAGTNASTGADRVAGVANESAAEDNTGAGNPDAHSPHERIRVVYADGSSYHCRPSRLIPIYTEPSTCVRNEPVVLVTDHTDRYRQLARTQIAKTDAVVEIGSDLGLCTAIMAEAVPDGRVLGIDKSPKSVEVARKTFPNISFLCEDVLANPGCLNCNPWSAVFIDINGNRLLPAVKQAIGIAQLLDPPPRLIVVKSVELHRQMTKQRRKQKKKRTTLNEYLEASAKKGCYSSPPSSLGGETQEGPAVRRTVQSASISACGAWDE